MPLLMLWLLSCAPHHSTTSPSTLPPRCVHLPMYGFTSSLNLAVATGLVLQQLFATYPQLRGNMEQAQQEQLKQRW